MGCVCPGACLCGPRSLDAMGEGEGREERMPRRTRPVSGMQFTVQMRKLGSRCVLLTASQGEGASPGPPSSEPRLCP